uniref:Uncharacterized protein n=1 Tax=Candidatus Desulfatibia profunda TaxID=2841695 RepID=A0A8J6TGQ0_9BACT|nr:hypothetical protein [Candidatus Desulfatibia profunda]
MSDYGLIVKNLSEEIQIDSIYRNLSLSQSGASETISNNWNELDPAAGDYWTRIALTSSALPPLVLLRPDTDNFVAVMAFVQSGSNYVNVDIITEYDNGPTTIDWQCYRQNLSGSGINYGILVYNSAGALCFDSGLQYFKIHSIHSISLDTPPVLPGALPTPSYGDYEDISHAGISNPYYILSPGSQWMHATTGEPPYVPSTAMLWKIGVKKLTSTSVRVGWFAYLFDQSDSIADTVNAGYNPTMKLIVCEP